MNIWFGDTEAINLAHVSLVLLRGMGTDEARTEVHFGGGLCLKLPAESFNELCDALAGRQ